ncbi:MAG: MarR family transcriptional regulator [Clostridia bacterium]|nr:MarR family transcriptional regulator [Clostridia bacterium]
MGHKNHSSQLRELISLLERKFVFLEKSVLSCCGITFAQCHAIIEIGRATSISLNDLADLLNLDKSTMSRTVNNLVTDHLAEREIDPDDRRYVTIKLTENGKKIFEGIEVSMDLYFKKVYESILEDKRQQVIESLQILLDAIGNNNCCR